MTMSRFSKLVRVNQNGVPLSSWAREIAHLRFSDIYLGCCQNMKISFYIKSLFVTIYKGVFPSIIDCSHIVEVLGVVI